MNVKMIPNALTAIRIMGAIALLFMPTTAMQYYIVYGVCGVTDAVDGLLARSLNAVSTFGSRLDSAADLLFYAGMLICNLPELCRRLPAWIWYFLGAVLVIRACSYLITAIRFHQFASYHSILNKLTGMFVFMIPFALLLITDFYVYGIITVSIAFIASLQELIYVIMRHPEKA